MKRSELVTGEIEYEVVCATCRKEIRVRGTKNLEQSVQVSAIQGWAAHLRENPTHVQAKGGAS